MKQIKDQYGITSILELLFVLVIIASLILMSVLYYQTVKQRNQVQFCYNMMQAIYSATVKSAELMNQEQVVAGKTYTSSQLVKAGVLAKAYKVNPWNNDMDLSWANNGVLTIKTGGMPKPACEQLYDRIKSVRSGLDQTGLNSIASCTAVNKQYQMSAEYVMP